MPKKEFQHKYSIGDTIYYLQPSRGNSRTGVPCSERIRGIEYHHYVHDSDSSESVSYRLTNSLLLSESLAFGTFDEMVAELKTRMEGNNA